MASVTISRIVVAATGSGAGKTTVATGLIAALRARGLKVAPFKCGPDYLDPGYHALAARAVSHNLDGWMMGRKGVLETFARASRGADIAVVEGMMGLFDSATPTTDEGSTAEIARWLDAPVLLVADVSGMARTIGALALGFTGFDPSIRLGGLICNRVGGRGHLELLHEAAPLIPILGGLPSTPAIAIPERHLGLRSALADAAAPLIESWRTLIEEWFDIDALLTLARSAPPLDVFDPPSTGLYSAPRCRIGLAYDEAFHFYYEYNLARLEELGVEIVRFSPIRDREPPAADGFYFGGGYPEVAAEKLAANRSMIEAVRAFATAGGPIYAECGGLMYLAEGIRTIDQTTFPMAGLIPGVAVMHDTMQALGYAMIETTAPSFLGLAGTSWRGHQFRYSTLDPPPPKGLERIYRVTPRWGAAPFAEGLRDGSVIASYVHAHWASNPDVPASFVRACTERRAARSPQGF
jgi:cobyrinic acid a,c-diamide synthase